MNKIKTIDFLMASVIFIVALLDFVSYLYCYNENYKGEVNGSNYLLDISPKITAIQWFIVSLYFFLKLFRFKLCIYTICITIIYFIIQIFNLLAVFLKFGTEIYFNFIYPFFIFSIFGLTLIKTIRWASVKRF